MGYSVFIREWDELIYIHMPDDSPEATFRRLANQQAYLRAYATNCHEKRIAAIRGKITSLRGCK